MSKQIDWNEIAKLRAEGMDWAMIGARYGMTADALKSRMRRRRVSENPEQQPPRMATLYAITDDTTLDGRMCVKVGVTSSRITDRIRQLQLGNPRQLRCLHLYDRIPVLLHGRLEQHVHAVWSRWQLPSNEWFAVDADELHRLPEIVQVFLSQVDG